MIIRITVKDPDGVYAWLKDAAKQSISGTEDILSIEEAEDLVERKLKYLGKLCEPWIGYSEYIKIEIDTEKNTAVVVRNQI